MEILLLEFSSLGTVAFLNVYSSSSNGVPSHFHCIYWIIVHGENPPSFLAFPISQQLSFPPMNTPTGSLDIDIYVHPVSPNSPAL